MNKEEKQLIKKNLILCDNNFHNTKSRDNAKPAIILQRGVLKTKKKEFLTDL